MSEPFNLQAFVITLTMVSGNRERWTVLIEKGATDEQIREQISHEFGLGCGYGCSELGNTWAVGGANPRFEWYFDLKSPHYKLEGKELADAVRGVFHIPEADGTRQPLLF